MRVSSKKLPSICNIFSLIGNASIKYKLDIQYIFNTHNGIVSKFTAVYALSIVSDVYLMTTDKRELVVCR